MTSKDLTAFILITSLIIFLSQIPKRTLGYCRKYIRKRNQTRRAQLLSLIGINEHSSPKKLLIGFFHPYCNAGGGGERVLWTAIALHQKTQPHTICAIYTGDVDTTKTDMIEKVKLRFGILLDTNTLLLIPLKFKYLVESSTWPHFTLLGQSIGSVMLGYEALCALVPDIYIDTMGYAFTFPIFRLLGQIPIGAYVHYPTISTNMLNRVSQRNATHNNSSTISHSRILSHAKLVYYKIFAEIYSMCLNQADHLMVNSTWTKNHIDQLLKKRLFNSQPNLKKTLQSEQEIEMKLRTQSIDNGNKSCNHPLQSDGFLLRHKDDLRFRKSTKDDGFCSEVKNDDGPDEELFSGDTKYQSRTKVVFPPCDVESFIEFPLKPRSHQILSISQFRPEKDQKTQIESFAKFLSNLNPSHPNKSSIRLILAGSCRDESDKKRVVELKELATKLGVADQVEFKVNISWNHLKDLLRESLVGLSTMVDEHFGISIVEFMASGLIPLAHNSGGPLLDIIVPIEKEDNMNEDNDNDDESLITGFHADGVDDYSIKLIKIFQDLNDQQILKIQSNARILSSRKFSVNQFETNWLDSFNFLIERKMT